ncbi:MAG: hypothetical protein JXA28_13565 [Bacteroidetes bacterium]|nr:hypothetical protein [Bacteroidota bacterium]
MRRYVLLLLLLLFIPRTAAAGPLLIAKDLPGWDISTPDFYSAKQLYGYINGGAELYLEYGFRQVTAQRCTKESHELQVDIYEMTSPEAAFGMYSILHGDCPAALSGAEWSCVAPVQILFARDRYLVSVVPYDRSTETRNAAKDAAAALLKRIGARDFRPDEIFRSGPLSPGRSALLFLRGPLALQNALPAWSDPLAGIDHFDLFFTRFGDGSRKTEAAILDCKSKQDLEKVLMQLGLPGAGKDWTQTKGGALIKRKSPRQIWYLKGGQAKALSKRIP